MLKFTDVTVDRKHQRFYYDQDRLISVNPTTKGIRDHDNLVNQAGIIPHTNKEGKMIRARQKTDSFGSGTLYMTDKHINQQYLKDCKKAAYLKKQAAKKLSKNL